MPQGKAIIFSAPSGSGKTTIVRHLLKTYPFLGFSISATTRPPRPQEIHGKDYYFLTLEDFRQKIEKDEFAEYEQVYEGKYYGTLKTEIQRLWDSGKHVIFDVDVKGGLKLKSYFKEKALAVFVKAPSVEDLFKRLEARNTESAESLAQRIEKANFELSFEEQFDVTLINENLEKAYLEAEKLISNFIAGPKVHFEQDQIQRKA